MNYFGNYITDLSISFGSMPTMQSEEIIRFVNEKTYKTVKTLWLTDVKGNVLDEIKHPFEKVTKLFYSTDIGELAVKYKENHRLSKLFPYLEELSLLEIKPSDWEFIDGQPSLVSLNFRKSHIHQSAVDFLLKNPQVNTVSFVSNNAERYVNEQYRDDWYIKVDDERSNPKTYRLIKK